MNNNDFGKIFVLDTNVLLHDCESIYKFKDNLIVIPMCVLEELDKFKKGQDENARNSRQFSRYMDKIREDGELQDGIKLSTGGYLKVSHDGNLKTITNITPDNLIIETALLEARKNPDKKVIVVSKDINLRVKADILGMEAEDYSTDKVNFEEMYTGVLVHEIFEPIEGVPDLHTLKEIDPSKIPNLPKMFPNQYLVIKYGKTKGLARYDANSNKLVALLNAGKSGMWGILPKNLEQTLAIDMLLNDDLKLVTLVGKAGTGKSQPISEPVLTPLGYRDMGTIVPDDLVIGKDGKAIKVLSIHPQGILDIYTVIFSDGSSTRCSEDHLWFTKTVLERDQHREGHTRTTKEIKESLTYGKENKKNHSIDMVDAVEFEKQDILLDPYLLGLFLGDGSFRHHLSLTTADNEIIEEAKKRLPDEDIFKQKNKYSFTIKRKKRTSQPSATKKIITYYNLMHKKSNSKFIPEVYKYNSVDTRIAVLQGLLDTDGTLDYRNGKSVSYCTVSPVLANDVKFLVESLGGNAQIQTKNKHYTYKGEKKKGQLAYNIAIRLPNNIQPFKLKRKSDIYLANEKYIPIRYITDVIPCGREECQCLKVDSVDSLYVTSDFIVTHNTLLSIAAGFHKTLTNENYKKIIVSRPIVPMGKDLGFLPGTAEEKMSPWMKPIFDNVDYLLSCQNTTGKGFNVSGKDLLEQGMIEVEPLTYIRGRSIPNQYLLIDESQNLTPHELKTIITRAGVGTKIILTGDCYQIDNPFLDSSSNGLSYVVERFKEEQISAHITLLKGERSELAEIASNIL